MKNLIARVVALVATVRGKLRVLRAKVAVVVRAVPAWGQAASVALTAIGTQVVPLLPGPWQVQAGGYVVVALGVVQSIVSVVARVYPIMFPDEKGLLPAVGDTSTGTQADADFWPTR